MVKVRITKKWYTHKAGDVVQVSESMARQLVHDRFAVMLPTGGRKPRAAHKTKTPDAVKG